MLIEPLFLKGAYYLEPDVLKDDRGFFFEWFSSRRFKEGTGVDFEIVQSNYSRSKRGVMRGLHYQINPNAQAKLVTVTRGTVQDIIVDLRKNSKTYGKSYSVQLSCEKRNQLFIPKGFAHGFLVLSEEAEVFYAVDNHYAPEDEAGIFFKCPEINLEWSLSPNEMVLSEKDKSLPHFSQAKNNFDG